MNILFLSFETEVFVIGQLAKRFKARGHRVFVACCDHYNVTHSRGEIYDYLRSLGLTDSEFANLDSVYRQMNSLPENLSETEVDWDFLRQFENRYKERFTLLELAAMDPLMSGAYHHRDIYYRPANKALFFKNIELHIKWLNEIFNQFRPDAVFSTYFQYFLKAASFTMSKSLGIPYLMLNTCRVQNLYLLYDNFGLGTPKSIREEMRRLEFSNDACPEATEFIEKLKEEPKPVYDACPEATEFIEKLKAEQKSSDISTMDRIHYKLSLKRRFHELWRYLYRYPRRAIFIYKHYRGLFRRNYFLPSYFALLRVMLITIWRRFAYFKHPELVRTDLPEGRFVFFPLHVIPENSVLTLSRTFDEFECLFQLSKTLPVGWKIVVKVHPGMLIDLDTHPNSYYLEMSRLPNVQFINPLISSTTIIPRASAVASISGTALLEGAAQGKPGFRWGQTEFEAIDLIHEFDPECLRSQLMGGPSRNLRFYIQACFNLGLRLDALLLNTPVLGSITPQQQEFERQLSMIESAILQYLETSASPVQPALAAVTL